MEPAPEKDEGLPEAIIRADEPVVETESAAQGQRPGLLRKKGIGPVLDEEAVHVLGPDGAAEAGPRFDHCQVKGLVTFPRKLQGTAGRGEPGHAAPDDGERPRLPTLAAGRDQGVIPCGGRSPREAPAGWRAKPRKFSGAFD
jgi:hypothetical protein